MMDLLPGHDVMLDQLRVKFGSVMELEIDFFRRPGRSADSWKIDLLRIFKYRPDQAHPFFYVLLREGGRKRSVAFIFLNALEEAELLDEPW